MMRAFIIATAAIAATTAWAQPAEPHTGQEAREAARAAGKELEQAAGAAKREAQDAASWMERELFSSRDRFQLEGSVQNVAKDSITVNRGDSLPPAKLKVKSRTNVELDGERVAIQRLKQGQDVHVSFNLTNDEAVAIEIQADSRGVLENEPRDDEPGVGRSSRTGAVQDR
jgi:hypothetical protein